MTRKICNEAASASYTTQDLVQLLAGIKLKLDCGHHCTIGHNFANTLIIYSLGNGRLQTSCHNCGY